MAIALAVVTLGVVAFTVVLLCEPNRSAERVAWAAVGAMAGGVLAVAALLAGMSAGG